MNHVQLSNRLATIAGHVPAGSRLADIGSDHALLPVFLRQRGQVVSAIAGEVNPGPFQAAQKQVREAGLEQSVDVRRGDGLAVVQPGEVDVITIAGMGGSLIVKILTDGQAKLQGVSRLILQPNVAADAVRRWLVEHDWVLTDEEILEEDGIVYEVLVADRSDSASSANEELYQETALPCGITLTREWLLKFGPHLLRHPNDAYRQRWSEELEKMTIMLNGLAKSESESARIRETDIRRDMDRIREVLACLPKDKR